MKKALVVVLDVCSGMDRAHGRYDSCLKAGHELCVDLLGALVSGCCCVWIHGINENR